MELVISVYFNIYIYAYACIAYHVGNLRNPYEPVNILLAYQVAMS